MSFREIVTIIKEKRDKLLLGIGIATAVIAAVFCVGLLSPKTVSTEPELIPMSPTPTPDIIVDVKGNVMNPGVYTLPGGSRVQDAVTAAGGLSSEENGEDVNLAKVLVDGEMIVIGKNKVNLNAADKEELETLPNIGETLAVRIIEYRKEYGAFYSIEEIMLVQGIGEGKFEDLKDLITV